MSEALPPTITVSVVSGEDWPPDDGAVRLVLNPGFAEQLAVVARDAARTTIAERLDFARELVVRSEARIINQRDAVASLEAALAELDEQAPPEDTHHHAFLRTLGWRCACGLSRAEFVSPPKEGGR